MIIVFTHSLLESFTQKICLYSMYLLTVFKLGFVSRKISISAVNDTTWSQWTRSVLNLPAQKAQKTVESLKSLIRSLHTASTSQFSAVSFRCVAFCSTAWVQLGPQQTTIAHHSTCIYHISDYFYCWPSLFLHKTASVQPAIDPELSWAQF